MAITSVKRKAGRSMQANRAGRSAQEIYEVQTDSATESATNIRTAVDPTTGMAVPLIGVQYDDDPYMRFTEIEPKQGDENSRLVWLVTCKAETFAPGTLISDNPLLDDPEIAWDDAETTEPIYSDRDGNAIENSAGETFDPPVTRLFFDQLVTVTRNVANFDPAYARQFKGKTNRFSFTVDGVPINAGKALLIGWSARSAIRNDIAYDVETIRIVMRDDGWGRNLLDHGYTELVNGENKVIKDVDGAPLNQPVKLNGSGQKLAEGEDAVFLYKEVYDEIDFSGIGLP